MKALTEDRKGIERRARAELELKAERVQPAVDRLRGVGRCAVIVSKSASIEDFRQGIDEKIGADKKGTARTLWLPADGNIQNANYDREAETLQAISELRRAAGFVVLAFEGVDLSGKSGQGTNRLIRRVTEIVKKQDKLQEEDGSRRNRMNRMGMTGQLYEGKHKRDFGLLLVGDGQPDDLTSRPEYDREYPYVSMLFMPRLMLLETGELTTDYIRESQGPRPQAAVQLELPL